MEKLRAAVIGVGYFGRFHARKLASIDDVALVAVVDLDADKARRTAAETGTRACTDYRRILDQVDLVSIAVPTESHYAVARDCFDAGVHVLLEKPVTRTLAEVNDLIARAEANDLIFQVGHLERYNPALLAMRDALREPQVIESYRLAPFTGRGADVGVVLDLMTHDLDIVLSLIPGRVRSLSSTGASLLTDEIDTATARIEFDNGCVARVTASRASPDSVRRLHVYQDDAYLSADFSNHRFVACRKLRRKTTALDVEFATRSFARADNLMTEIRAFTESVAYGLPPMVSGYDGRYALEIALAINSSMKKAAEAYRCH